MATQLRLLSDAYDSCKQPLLVGWEDDDRLSEMIGRLRLDALLYDRIVVTDSDIFDGMFFQAAANARRLAELPWARIEIKTRAATLEDSFLQSFRPTGQSHLSKYIFSTVPVQLAGALAERLSKYTSKEVRTLEGFADAIDREGGGAYSSRLLLGWEALLEHVEISGCRVTCWGDTPFTLQSILEQSKSDIVRSMHTEHGRSRFEDVLDHQGSRNSVMNFLMPDLDALGGEEQRDVATLHTWYNGAFRVAQARSHECNQVELFRTVGCRPFHSDFASPNAWRWHESEPAYRLPPTFLKALGKIPVVEWESYSSRDGVADQIADWRKSASRSSLQRAIETLVEWLQMQGYLAAPPPLLPSGTGALAAAGVAGIATSLLDQHAPTSVSRRFIVGAGTFALTFASTEAGRIVDATTGTSRHARAIANSVVLLQERRAM